MSGKATHFRSAARYCPAIGPPLILSGVLVYFTGALSPISADYGPVGRSRFSSVDFVEDAARLCIAPLTISRMPFES
jgi:hypothetical protein